MGALARSEFRTLETEGLWARPKGAHSPFVDALTAPPKSYGSTMLLFPITRTTFQHVCSDSLSIPKERLDLAHAELYLHAYQTVGSLMLAMINVDIARKIRQFTELLERGNREYEDNLRTMAEVLRKAKFSFGPTRDEKLEQGVRLAIQGRDEVNGLIDRLAESPYDLSLCTQMDALCASFEEIYELVRYSQFVSSRELLKTLPSFSFYETGFGGLGRSFQSLQDVIDFLGRTADFFHSINYVPGADNVPDVNNLQINARLAGVHIRLMSHARASHTFGSAIPKGIPHEIEPIGLLIEADDKATGTYFSALFEATEARLRKIFECQVLTGPERTLVFFPKMDEAELPGPRPQLP